MREIEAIPWNGYNVVSTFSGCGGSCLGYRMAGFKVLWANEFIPAAIETYKANHPTTFLDRHDIRDVTAKDILDRLNMLPGDVDLLEGSPPCASFSTAGKRAKGWGQVKQYSDTKQRVDDLFFEYTRLLKDLQPKTFVAENVSGLVKGAAKGYFLDILKELKSCGYVVSTKLLDAQWLGVPQMRQRIIFVGVRNDLVERYHVKPVHPQPLPYRYTVREALPWIQKIEGANGYDSHTFYSSDTPNATVQATGALLVRAIRDDRGTFGTGGDITDSPSPTRLSDSVGTHWIEQQVIEPESDISKYAIGKEWEKLKPGEQSEKYFQLVRAPLDAPCPTVTQSAGTAWAPSAAAGVTHPTEKRKFSIAELKRICAFPDDFILTGTYSQQWERLGRAVPPVMMMHIAKTIKEQILDRCK